MPELATKIRIVKSPRGVHVEIDGVEVPWCLHADDGVEVETTTGGAHVVNLRVLCSEIETETRR